MIRIFHYSDVYFAALLHTFNNNNLLQEHELFKLILTFITNQPTTLLPHFDFCTKFYNNQIILFIGLICESNQCEMIYLTSISGLCECPSYNYLSNSNK